MNIREQFLAEMGKITQAHRPSASPFFSSLAALRPEIAHSPKLLGEIYLFYQCAMHSTRAAVYYLPFLDAPGLRVRKLQILADDDGLPDNDTHHYQLSRAFAAMGVRLPLGDEEFGTIDELCDKVDDRLVPFLRNVQQLYPRSHGAWCIVEMLSVEWMTSLVDALAVHFPSVRQEPYFAECFDKKVEERHAAEALALAADTLERRPHLYDQTVADAQSMAASLDALWELLDGVVSRYA